jgi:hypothetical protein
VIGHFGRIDISRQQCRVEYWHPVR